MRVATYQGCYIYGGVATGNFPNEIVFMEEVRKRVLENLTIEAVLKGH